MISSRVNFEESCISPDAFKDCGVYKAPRVDDEIGPVKETPAFDRDQFGVSGTGAYEVYRPFPLHRRTIISEK